MYTHTHTLSLSLAHTHTQARLDSGADVVVGVNKFVAADDKAVDALRIDNVAVREAQVPKPYSKPQSKPYSPPFLKP